jgi:hypothetical protein
MAGYPMGNPRGFRVPLPPGWVDLTTAALALGIPRRSLWKGIQTGEIRAYRVFIVKNRKFYGFKREDLGI